MEVGQRIVALVFVESRDWLAGVSAEGDAFIWDARSGTELYHWHAHDWSQFEEPYVNAHSSLSVHPEGRYLATCGELPDLAIWDLEMLERPNAAKSFQPVERFDEEGWISAVTFSDDICAFVGGRRGRAGRSHIARLQEGKLTNILTQKHEEWVRQVAISGDHQLLALQEDFSSGLIHVYSLEEMHERLMFKVSGHAHRTVAVAFTPDSTQLITGGDDGTARFWDAQSGELVGTLVVEERVRFIGFLPQSHDMVTASPEGWLRFWKREPVFIP